MILKIVIGLLVLSFIVIIHELGHLLLAKKAGIRVEEFCVGLGPRLIYKQVGETIYSLRLFPIGGACMMTGEEQEVENDDKSFNSKTVWQRISVVVAGPIFNFILAFVISLILIWSTGVNLPKVTKVESNSPAAKAGIKAGDTIAKINGKNIVTFEDIDLETFNSGTKPLEVSYYGENKEIKTVTLTPESSNGIPVLGIPKSGVKDRVNFISSFRYAGHEVKYWIESVFVSLKKIFAGEVSRKDVSGPIGIVNMIGGAVEKGASAGIGVALSTLAFFTILISANLGVMNLLPFPALDGGRLIFLLLELIRGKRINQKIEGYVNAVGFIILMGLMVFMFYNDILNIMNK